MAMTIVEATRPVTGGVDTHLHVHVAATLDSIGGLLGVESFPTTPAGYRKLLGWMGSFGPVERVGVEGTGAYGAGLARFLQRRGTQAQGSGDTAANQRLSEEPDPAAEPEAAWEEEYHKHVFRLACERVRPVVAAATWDAFWRTAVEGQETSAVARTLGMSVGAVYVAKSRVLTRLTEEIRGMEADG